MGKLVDYCIEQLSASPDQGFLPKSYLYVSIMNRLVVLSIIYYSIYIKF